MFVMERWLDELGPEGEHWESVANCAEETLAAFSALPRQDYAAADILIKKWRPPLAIGGEGRANPDFDRLLTVRLPEWPPVPARLVGASKPDLARVEIHVGRDHRLALRNTSCVERWGYDRGRSACMRRANCNSILPGLSQWSKEGNEDRASGLPEPGAANGLLTCPFSARKQDVDMQDRGASFLRRKSCRGA